MSSLDERHVVALDRGRLAQPRGYQTDLAQAVDDASLRSTSTCVAPACAENTRLLEPIT